MAKELVGRDADFSRSDFVSFAAQFAITAKAIDASIVKLVREISI